MLHALAYGGGIRDLDDIRLILAMGVEKIVLNTAAFDSPDLIKDAAREFGSQSIVVSIDVKKKFWGGYEVVARRARKKPGWTRCSSRNVWLNWARVKFC